MIKIEKTEVYGWEAAIRGMRNPMNSWDRMDSYFEHGLSIGQNDHDLMMRLAKGGAVHAKYRRMITVTCDIVAPQVWWSEFDTYKIATVRNSCSKMHKIHVKPFEYDDFTHEGCDQIGYAFSALCGVINVCERLRQDFNRTQDKKYWRALIELLPEGYNMRATVQMDYEVLVGMYRWRKDHKLDEWREFCKWVEALPYSEIITGEQG